MNSQDKPTAVIQGRPPNPDEIFLKQKYLENITKQPDIMDALAKQLLTIVVAVPGLYVCILKLVSGDKATVTLTIDVYFTFGFWLLSLIFSIIALWPRVYRVDANNHTEIRNSFFHIARYKVIWLGVSILMFEIALLFALKGIFI